MKRETVVVLDFGGQYNQLVARRVRECNVYCEIYSYKTDLEKIKAMNPKGIILTGGPNSCYEADSPTCNKELFELGIPVLGLCYGAQLMMHVLGGKVEKADVSEYGKTEVLVDKTDSKIFKDVSDKTICWMSHTDYISQVAPGFEIAAHTADCPVATAQNEEKKLYAIQFHPEVLHTVGVVDGAVGLYHVLGTHAVLHHHQRLAVTVIQLDQAVAQALGVDLPAPVGGGQIRVLDAQHSIAGGALCMCT